MHRVGLGMDSHRLCDQKNGQVILGGVVVGEHKIVEANSEGDVVIHALCNALSTAIGGGSLDTWAGPLFKTGVTDSKVFLDAIVKKVNQEHMIINNVAIMIEAAWPRLEHHRHRMTSTLADLLHIKENQIGIACTSGEKLTAFGRGEGIYVMAQVLLEEVLC